MKTLILLQFTLLSVLFANAQYGNFRKYQIAQTGYYCYLPSDPGQFDEQHSEDGQLMYTKEVFVNEITFGIITVFLNENFAASGSEDLKSLLVSYMDFLKTQFEVTDSVGYGYGHTTESNPKAQGVLDYWKDKDGNELVVKGWIDNKALAFLFILGKELPNHNVQSLFLNGFVFKK